VTAVGEERASVVVELDGEGAPEWDRVWVAYRQQPPFHHFKFEGRTLRANMRRDEVENAYRLLRQALKQIDQEVRGDVLKRLQREADGRAWAQGMTEKLNG
jgi:hypothetical protein